MNIEQLMTTEVHVCQPDDTLNKAAQLMWEQDVGCVPIVDADFRLAGIVTDRDICMAAYIQGRALSDMRARDLCGRVLHSCRPTASVETAVSLMSTHQIRRIPITDDEHRLVGLLSIADVVRNGQDASSSRGNGLSRGLTRALAMISHANRGEPVSRHTAPAPVRNGKSGVRRSETHTNGSG
jgi:CBS domain-containing protein